MTRAEALQILLDHTDITDPNNTTNIVDAMLRAVAIQRAHDAAICRRMHTESQQRFEMAMVCAREIERDTT